MTGEGVLRTFPLPLEQSVDLDRSAQIAGRLSRFDLTWIAIARLSGRPSIVADSVLYQQLTATVTDQSGLRVIWLPDYMDDWDADRGAARQL